MKGKTGDRLIQYLLHQNDYKRAAVLASKLDVTDRTIRKQVAQINERYSRQVIFSSAKGYKLSIPAYQKEVSATTNQAPETKRERLHFLINRLMITKSAGLDIYELSDELFLSETTVRADMQNVRQFLQDFQITLQSRGDKYSIAGDEVRKREVMRYLAIEESKNPINQRHSIQVILGDIAIQDLQGIITNTLAGHNFFINGYEMDNVLLHFAITIQRIRENNSITKNNMKKRVTNMQEYAITTSITKKITAQYDIPFTFSEIYYLTLLLIGKTTLANYNSLTSGELEIYIGKEIIQLVDRILQKVKTMYFIDMRKDGFIVKFTIHVHNLINRANITHLAKNPLSEEIKSSYPLLYDISVFIASEIASEKNIMINDDEIAYIALHIGSFIEYENGHHEKVTCLIICPQYYDIHKCITQKIEQKFGSELTIIMVETEIDGNWKKRKPDLIVTTTYITSETTDYIVYVRPFLTTSDLHNISKEISNIKKAKKQQTMSRYIEQFFHSDLFFKNKAIQNKFQTIEFLAHQLTKQGFTTSDFVEDVIERECMSSTAFSNGVAVPHSMTMKAIRTGVAILVEKKAVPWDKKSVQIIVLIAVNEKDSPIFGDLFESFINVLSEEVNIKLLAQTESHLAFQEMLLQLMDGSD
ncbi:transcription antiterminator [Listeria rocourtiae]|uniref:BglG family transcription antiterminator n=1 Tax=Listeria rocourtiae TaxID=647910 RepID=UPI0016267591|nr:BglG family transcription antiterminator [Listeria rocourtiae]MBC1435573.1 transcription antiterminator [Listeria rocourtiae]